MPAKLPLLQHATLACSCLFGHACHRVAAGASPPLIMSNAGVPIERISRLVGHSDTTTTETIYRHQIRPVVQGGAEVMDKLFARKSPDA